MTRNKYLLACILGISLFVTFSKLSVSADGMMIRPDPYSSRWDYKRENFQQAYINYSNGVQKMLIGIGVNSEKDESALWLFPVPAKPQDVKIDIFSSLPILRGEDVTKKTLMNLQSYSYSLLNTQIYPLPFTLISTSLVGAAPGMNIGNKSLNPFDTSDVSQVVVVDSINKEGITTELISAKSADALYQYFTNKGLTVDKSLLSVLDYYIGKEYSFVASWISSGNTKENDMRGVYLSFPTDKIFFPLIPTSVYGDVVIPASLRIIGYVNNDLPESIKPYSTVAYYHQNSLDVRTDISSLFDGLESSWQIAGYKTLKNIMYTKIEIGAKSSNLKEDIALPPFSRPVLPTILGFLASHPSILWLVYSGLIASICSLLSGLLVFKEFRNLRGLLKLFFVGLLNFFTIIGVIIGIACLKTKTTELDVPLLSSLKSKNYIVKRRIGFVLAIAITPFFIVSIFALVSFPSYITQIFKDIFEALTSNIGSWTYVWHDLIMLGSVALPLIGVILIRKFFLKIKPEDVALFEEVKKAGYSTHTFNPSDNRKVKFVVIFSALILVFSFTSLFLGEKAKDPESERRSDYPINTRVNPFD